MLSRNCASRWRWLVAIGVVVGATACGAGKRPLWFQASGPNATADGIAVLQTHGVVVRVQETHGPDRAAKLRDLVGLATDPFEVGGDGEVTYRTFLLEIDNQSGHTLRYNPSFAALSFNGDRRFPIGFSELYRFLRKVMKDESAMSRLSSMLDETFFEVASGTQITKLLVFDRVEKNVKKATLELPGFAVGEDEATLKVVFRR